MPVPPSVIIGIHGLTNKPPLADKPEYWKKALIEGRRPRAAADLLKRGHRAVPAHYVLSLWREAVYAGEPHSTNFTPLPRTRRARRHLKPAPLGLQISAPDPHSPRLVSSSSIADRKLDARPG
jgi:hypothetical protein